MNRQKEALENYDLAFQKGPENFKYLTNKATTLFSVYLNKIIEKMNRLEEALENYDLAINKNPEDSKIFNNKGILQHLTYYIKWILNVVLQKMNKFEAALLNYDLAIQRNPKISQYYYNKAITLFNVFSNQFLEKINNLEEALEYYDLAISITLKNQTISKLKLMLQLYQIYIKGQNNYINLKRHRKIINQKLQKAEIENEIELNYKYINCLNLLKFKMVIYSLCKQTLDFNL